MMLSSGVYLVTHMTSGIPAMLSLSTVVYKAAIVSDVRNISTRKASAQRPQILNTGDTGKHYSKLGANE